MNGFIAKSKSAHGDRYDYSKVDYVNSKTKVIIVCADHGEFLQTPSAHQQGQGCPKCNPRSTHGLTKFVELARGVHGDRYDYSKVDYVNSKTKVIIVCADHGEFKQTPANHKQGNGCTMCGNSKAALTRTHTTDAWVAMVTTIHGDHYDYSRVEYVSDRTPVTIICPTCGEFEQHPHDHRMGCGCPKCRPNSKKTNSIFITDAIAVHGDRYDYSGVEYTNAHGNIDIRCSIHGGFTQAAGWHLNGGGCPKCNNNGKSKGETALLDHFVNNGISVIRNSRTIIPPYELDGYFPEHNIAVEYCGLYWHSELRGRDKKYHSNKRELCDKLGITLITVFEDEWIVRPEIVKARISHMLGLSTNRVYARKCVVREISLGEARDFLNLHHLQGYAGCRHRFGIFDTDELVGVMTFSLPTIAKGSRAANVGTFEISRFATSKSVVGGGSKLLKAFEKVYQPVTVFSYADLRWGNGDSYLKMGFTYAGDTGCNYWYFKTRDKRYHRFGLRKNSNDDQSITGWENRRLQGWNRIWDCGSRKYTKHYPTVATRGNDGQVNNM